MSEWLRAQEWEKEWHGFCNNTFNEETKQYIYAKYMGLDEYATNSYGRRGWDFGELSVLDIGGGPASLLLKSKAKIRQVIDPCKFPQWVYRRYEQCGILFWGHKAEEIGADCSVDLILIYNCLQHTDDPQKIITVAKQHTKEIRIFEWIDTPISDGHIHTLKENDLNKWLGGIGKTRDMNGEAGLVGKAYCGVFPVK